MSAENMTRRGFTGLMGVAGVAGAVGAAGALGAGTLAAPKEAKAETLLSLDQVSDEYTNAELDAMVMAESEVNGDYIAPTARSSRPSTCACATA